MVCSSWHDWDFGGNVAEDACNINRSVARGGMVFGRNVFLLSVIRLVCSRLIGD